LAILRPPIQREESRPTPAGHTVLAKTAGGKNLDASGGALPKGPPGFYATEFT